MHGVRNVDKGRDPNVGSRSPTCVFFFFFSSIWHKFLKVKSYVEVNVILMYIINVDICIFENFLQLKKILQVDIFYAKI